MTNEVISKARGECQSIASVNDRCPECGKPTIYGACVHYRTDYRDPSAWTPELLRWIEAQGLKSKFMCYALGIRYHFIEGRAYTEDEAWELLKRTPEQKARALAKAIEEEK